MLAKIGLFLLSGVVAYGFILYSRTLVKFFGQNSWAERKLGPGGSELMWKLIGIVVFILGLVNLTGGLPF